MFEQIVEQVPELGKLEKAISALEQEQAKAQSRVQGLATLVAQARENDLNREALALNAGTRPPKPQEPKLGEQLEGAQRELEVLQRRLTLAQSQRSRFIAENSDYLAALLDDALSAEGEKVAEGAGKVLADLLRYFTVEDDIRALARLAPTPAPENVGEPEKVAVVWGPMTTYNVTGGPARGDLEAALRYLQSLGPATEVAEEGAAGSEVSSHDPRS